jgi:hypothetical protein
LPSEERCTPEVCAAPLACVADQCRTSCGGDDDCREGTCSSGTCVEPVGGADAGGGVDGGGVDAGVLVDTGPQTDAGVTCDTSGWPADQALLDGLFSDTLTGPAGLRAIRSTTLGPFPTPTEGGVAVAGQIAVAARLDTGVGHAWVLWLEGTTRATHLMTLPLDRPELAMDADLGGGAIVDVRSFDLHTDRNAFVGVITSRSDAGVVGVHLVDEDATQLVTSASMFQSAHPSDTVLGRAIVTGGLSAFAGSTAVPVRYVVGDGSVARSIGRDGTLEDTVFPSAVGFLDGAGAAGEIYVFGDTTYGAGIWNLHGGPTSTRMITTSISGPPTVATLASDPTVAFVAWPDGHAVSLTHYDCTANCTSVASASTPPEATLFARRAALATLGSGVALVTLYTDASDQSPTLRVEHGDARRAGRAFADGDRARRGSADRRRARLDRRDRPARRGSRDRRAPPRHGRDARPCVAGRRLRLRDVMRPMLDASSN